jgi:hypothetical protein
LFYACTLQICGRGEEFRKRAAEIETKRVRKQNTDRQDAHLLLKLLLENDFP